LSDFHGIVAAPAFTCDPRDLLAACGLSAWDFDHLLAAQTMFEPYHHSKTGSPFLDVSKGYEEYAAERRRAGSEQIKKNGTLRRKFEREIGPLRFEAHCPDPAMLERLMRLKSEQYATTGVDDIFAERWVRHVLAEIHAAQSPTFAGMLSVLYANDEPAAVHFGMRSDTVWHYWFPAYEPRFSHYSPGLILLLEIAQCAPAIGLKSIDLGKGETLYKQRLMSGEIPLAEGSVERPSFATVTRRLRRSFRSMVRNSPLGPPARAVVGMMRRAK
jgi:CelD/BcsL family acetyltransferase involved in cellulose biosynthesis